ncbi:dynein axonemal heavy chain 5-like [Amia ocellicauda]|uniref:dynein axonemal heavy chain 5-like n=1 Tax=Amia ocellicauda TaxID=2972642 RepID=UPI0034648AE4
MAGLGRSTAACSPHKLCVVPLQLVHTDAPAGETVRPQESIFTSWEEHYSCRTGICLVRRRCCVLCAEARRVTAAREQRRSQLDLRHRYLVSSLADAVGLGEAEVEQALVSDQKFSSIQDFFAQNGGKALLFFYQGDSMGKQSTPPWTDSSSVCTPSEQAQKKLFVISGCAEGLTGLCLFFLRTTEKAITTANVSQEVTFGMLDGSDGNILHSVEMLFSQVMLPALRAQENWGAVKEGVNSSEVQDFLSSVETFVSCLSSTRLNMEGKFQLKAQDLGYNLDNLQGPSDYTAAAGTSELVEAMEAELLRWVWQIELVLTESEQMRRDADDIGPSAELEHWKKRVATFSRCVTTPSHGSD